MNPFPGTLYICPTPLGNLEDITLRVLRTLKDVNLIAAENTAHTQKLLHHFGIQKQMVSYYDSGQSEAKEEKLVEKLKSGNSIALVSSAGTPLISDPGFRLIRKCVEEKIPVVSLPGPSAAITALTASGLPPHNFFFGGFLPSKPKARRATLQKLADYPFTLVLFEAPHRIARSLFDCLEILGDRPCAMARELTKIHEEIVRGTLSELSASLAKNCPRGEITLIISGKEIPSEVDREKLEKEIHEHLEKGESISEASRELAKKYDIPKREIYALAHRTAR